MMRKAIGLAGCALLVGAAPAGQQTPGPAALAECRLNYAEAQKVTATLKEVDSIDESNADEQNVTHSYALQGVSVFGLNVTLFTLNEFDDKKIHQHMFGTEIGNSFAAARTALLRGHGKPKCELIDIDEPGNRTCLIHLRTDNSDETHDVDLLLAERNNSVRTGCVYSSPGALH